MLKLAGYKVNTEGDEIESCDHAFTVIKVECAGNRDVKYRISLVNENMTGLKSVNDISHRRILQ